MMIDPATPLSWYGAVLQRRGEDPSFFSSEARLVGRYVHTAERVTLTTGGFIRPMRNEDGKYLFLALLSLKAEKEDEWGSPCVVCWCDTDELLIVGDNTLSVEDDGIYMYVTVDPDELEPALRAYVCEPK